MRIEEGEGWRLLFDPARSPYCVLIGGTGWAAEFTVGEFRALERAVAGLVQQHRALTPELLAEEAITLEMEVELDEAPEPGNLEDPGAGVLWVALEGDRSVWSLRFILTPGGGRGGRRALEGSWTAAASLPLALALEQARSAGLG